MAIIAAIDRSDRSDDVIREADALAKAFNEDIHVVHALSRTEFIDLGRTRAKKGDPIDMEEVRDVAADIASEAAADLSATYKSVGLMGKPSAKVVEYASDLDARYIVAGGRKRSPAGKLVFGSVLQSILLNADCPVISMISDT